MLVEFHISGPLQQTESALKQLGRDGWDIHSIMKTGTTSHDLNPSILITTSHPQAERKTTRNDY